MKKYFKHVLFSILGFAIISYAELPDPPKGIHIKYATTEDLGRTLMDKGEILVNEDDVSDVRIGDGVTYGGKQIASSVLANYFPLTGGVLNGYLIDIAPTNEAENPTIVLRRNNTTWKIINDGQIKFIRYANDTEYEPALQLHDSGARINDNLMVDNYVRVGLTPVIPADLSIAVGTYAYTRGLNSISVGNNTHAFTNAAAFGENNYAYGHNSMANGSRAYSIGNSSHAEGSGTLSTDTNLLFTSSGTSISAKRKLYSNKNHGLQKYDFLKYGYLEKYVYVSSIPDSTTVVLNTTFTSEMLSNAVLTKLSNVAYGDNSHVEGNNVKAIGNNSHAEGNDAKSIGNNSHAEGYYTQAIGTSAHAEGYYTQANGYASHAEGDNTQSSGNNSHAEGSGTQANGNNSHAEGSGTQANGNNSHAEGYYTQANGYDSHASGNYAMATNDYAWVWSAHLINKLKEFELTNYNDTEFNLPGIPKNKTFESIFGIDQNTWENLDYMYVYYEEDDYYIDNYVFLTENGWFTKNEDDELVSINSYIENIPYDKFLKISFTFDIKNSADEITWTTELYDARYYSHGDRTFNVNPEGGTDGFYIGETNLTDHIKNISSNNLPIATADSLGGVKVGNNLNVTEDGTLSVPNADAATSTKGVTYLITDSFGTTSEDGRVGYATTEYAARQFIKKSVFPYPIFQTTNTYNIGDRICYKFNVYECLEDNVSGIWSVVSNKFKVIAPIQTQIDDINSNVSSISNFVDMISDKVDSIDSEEWTFTLDDGSQVVKKICIMQ